MMDLRSGFSIYGELKDQEYKRAVLLGVYFPMLISISIGVVSSSIGYFIHGSISIISYLVVTGSFMILLLIGWLILSRRVLYSGLFLIVLIAFAGFYTVFEWGIAHSIGLLLIALTVFLTSLLFDSKASRGLGLLIILLFVILTSLQLFEVIPVNYEWKPIPTIYDALILILILAIVLLTSSIYSAGLQDQMESIKKLTKELQDINSELNRKVLLKTKKLISNRSELKETYESLSKAYSLMEGIEQDRFTTMNKLAHYGTILTSLVHEMANPVMILMDILDRSAMRDKKAAMEAINEVAETIKSVRMGVKSNSEQEIIVVGQAIRDVVNMLAWKTKREDINLRVQLETSQEISGDRGKFRQILLNLLDNALDAASGRGRKEVSILLNRKGNIRISDSGQGIPTDDFSKVFTIFYSTKTSGSGIGLFIARKYALELFNGNVQIAESGMNGTIIEFTFGHNL